MARDFTPTTDIIQIGDPAAIDITGTALTVSVRINSDDLSANRAIVAKDLQYSIYTLSTGAPYFEIGDGAAVDSVTGGTTLSATTWYHLVGVKNGTGADAIKVYLNGAQDGTNTSNKSIANTANNLRFGINSAGSASHDGRIAEVIIWDRALTAAEIANLYNNELPPYAPKGYWPLYGTTSPEPDFSGNHNHGTVTGTARADHPPRIKTWLYDVHPVLAVAAAVQAGFISMLAFWMGGAGSVPAAAGAKNYYSGGFANAQRINRGIGWVN